MKGFTGVCDSEKERSAQYEEALTIELWRRISDGEFDNELERFLTHKSIMIRICALKRWQLEKDVIEKERLAALSPLKKQQEGAELLRRLSKDSSFCIVTARQRPS